MFSTALTLDNDKKTDFLYIMQTQRFGQIPLTFLK